MPTRHGLATRPPRAPRAPRGVDPELPDGRDGPALANREGGIAAAARFISSPYDPDAHYARKHATSWVGYKVHLTETCEDDTPI